MMMMESYFLWIHITELRTNGRLGGVGLGLAPSTPYTLRIIYLVLGAKLILRALASPSEPRATV